jgi:hypothetical protein
MKRQLAVCLLVGVSGCALDSYPPPPPDAPYSPHPVSAAVYASWSGQDVVSADPEDSRVPRTLTGPLKPCPNIVGDPVVQVDIEVDIGQENTYVADTVFDCALGYATIPVPAGSGIFRLDVFTESGYAWLSAYGPISTTTGETTNMGVADLNNEIPTSSGGGDDGPTGLGAYL